MSSRVGTHRRRLWLALAVAALVVVPAAIAWACNPQAHMTLDRTSYGPGQTMTVSGSYFRAGDEIAVTVPGDSATATVSSGGGFTVTLSAPGSPGNYTATASLANGGYRAGLPKTASFSVAQPASQPAQSPAGAPPAEQQQSPSFSEPGVSHSPASGVSHRGGGGNQGGGGGGRGGGGPVAGVGGGGTTVTGTTGQTVFAGSVAPAQQAAFAPGAGAAGSAAKSTAGSRGGAARPSERAAAADVWSGFAPGRTPSLTSAAAGAPDGGTGSQLGLGIGLLAAGLLALATGLTAAEVRRRRAYAGRR